MQHPFFKLFLILTSYILFCTTVSAAPQASSTQAAIALIETNKELNELPPDIARILERGTLMVGILKKDAPPFFSRSTFGQLQGYDIELAKDIANRLGVKITFNREAETYDELANMLAQRKIDLVASVVPTLSRAKKARFSELLLELKQALLVNRLVFTSGEDEKPEDILYHKGITIGVLKGSVYESYFINSYPNTPIKLYESTDQAMQDVVANKLTGVFYSEEQIAYWLKQHPNANLYTKFLRIPNRTIPLSIAVRWSDIYLLNWIDAYLETIQNNSFADRLYKRYLGDREW
jgi:polar amino acid transport system substrate-binding protein